MILIDAARDHAVAAVIATANLLVAIGSVVALFAAEIPDGAITAAVLFVLGTGTGIAGWSLVLLVRLSQVVARLESTSEDHDRRLGSGGL